jgi:hypothetical protein
MQTYFATLVNPESNPGQIPSVCGRGQASRKPTANGSGTGVAVDESLVAPVSPTDQILCSI